MYPRLFEIPLPFEIGGLEEITVYSYGFMIVVAVLAAASMARKELDRLYRNGRIGPVHVPVKEREEGRAQVREVSPSHIIGTVATLVVGGKYRANLWQGRFPYNNEVEDGYQYTSPVGAFGETRLGLTDMGGNVWEWTSSWYRPYSERGRPFAPTKRSEKVQRGGSFQCNRCLGFRVYTRSHSTPETSLFHVGFRCAQRLPTSD